MRAQSGFGENKSWENHFSLIAQALKELAEAHAQQDSSFQRTITYTRITTSEAIRQLQALGYEQKQLPSTSTMALVLNLLGDN